MTAKLTYARHNVRGTAPYADVQTAARAAISGQDAGDIFALKIEDASGTVVWERDDYRLPTDAENTALEKLARGVGNESS